MANNDNLYQILLRELQVLLCPLAVLPDGDVGTRLVSKIIGWDVQPGVVPGNDGRIASFVDAYDALDVLAEVEAIADVVRALDGLGRLLELVENMPFETAAGALGETVVEGLLLEYLRVWRAPFYDLLVLLTAIRPPGELALDKLPKLLSDPVAVLRGEYLPHGLVTAEDASATAERLFPRLAALLNDVGYEAHYNASPAEDMLPAHVASSVAGGVLTIFPQPNFQEPNRYAVRFALSPKDLGDLGVVVVPSGIRSADWDALDLTAAVGGFAIGRNGLRLLGASSALSQRARSVEVSGLTIGSSSGTRLELGQLQLSAALDLAPEDYEYGASLEMGRSTFVVSPGDADSFIASFVPTDGVTGSFELSIGWSNKKGFYLQGSGGLEVTIPIHESFGPVSVKRMVLSLESNGSRLSTVAAVSFGINLGPLDVEIDRLGARVDADFDSPSPNLKLADVALGISPPLGAGLSINGGPIKGGGYLTHDPKRGRYAGVATLSLMDLAISAYGVIDTKVPEGFSLLVVIGSQIPPIPLGLGFRLLGVGGLLGVNRTAALDVIRNGLRDGGLAHVLYPDNPIDQFDEIIAETDRIFPIKRGRVLIGPTLKIGWGVPTLITADIGLIYELPDPSRIAFLGVVRCYLPDPETPLLRLNASFLGTADLARGELAFDASLFDSKLLSFSLDGDMSARLKLGLIPNYLLTVGGFHPAFTPPPMGLPPLRRITLNLLDGDNPRLRAELYLARTSNTFQIGAHVELYAAVSKFNVYGFVGFDALISVRPTKFSAEVKATLAVRLGEDPIMSVGVDFLLEGPSPWHAKGNAHFKLCWFLSFSVSFDRTWGDIIEVLAGAIDVLPLLGAALGDSRNWHAPLPSGAHALATLRRTDDQLVDPGGTLMITQKLVPLDLTIDRFSSLKPQDANRFSITSVTTGGDLLDTVSADDEFAAAEFLDMSDAEKLARPSFERFASGVTIASAEKLVAGDAIGLDVDYERIIVDKGSPARRVGRLGLDAAAFDGLVRASAVSRSPLAKNAAFAPQSEHVALVNETYAVVSATDLSATSARRTLTYAEAIEELAAARRASPSASLQIVTTAEVA